MISNPAEEALRLLQQLISIPSFSREEIDAADYLYRFIVSKGCITSRLENNIWTICPDFDSSRPTILLNSHIDTVRPVSGWTHDPFLPLIDNGKLYGLGSNDAGASMVGLLFSYFELIKHPQQYNLIFAATAEEEISGKNGIESLIKKLPEIDFAVVGEPTSMQPAIAEKGLMVLDCTAYGQAGHAARYDGENAIYKALQDIDWLRNYKFAESSELLGDVKMTVTQINAGTQHNVIPDRCTFVVDIRSNEKYTNKAILSEIKKHIQCEVYARSIRLGSSFTPKNHPFVSRAIELNLTPFGSPTTSDQALISCPSVKIGPGHSERSHTADEYIQIAEIAESIDVYFKLLNGLELK